MIRSALKHPVGFITDHRFTRTRASDYIDDTLDHAARQRIDDHTHECPACMRFISTLQRTVTAIRALATHEPRAAGVSAGVLARLRTVTDDLPSSDETSPSADGP